MFGRIDWDDRIAAVVFLLASAVNNHIVSGPELLFGWGLRDVLFTIGANTADPAGITLGKILALGALVGTIVTNRTDFSKLAGIEMFTAIATFGLILSPPFIPLLELLLQSSTIAGAFALVLQAGGFFSVSYLG